MKWHNITENLPTKNGNYLTVSHIKLSDGNHYIYEVRSWANNLREHSFYFDDEEYEHSGFYSHDPEWGAYEVSNVDAWCEIDEYIP